METKNKTQSIVFLSVGIEQKAEKDIKMAHMIIINK